MTAPVTTPVTPDETRSTTASASVLDRIAVTLATGFGIGFVPWAPGTFGSLFGLPYAWLLWTIPPVPRVVVAILVVLAGIPICDRAARRMGKKDPGSIVFDEIAAFSLVFAVVPFDPVTAILGFVLFRLFDITKPVPARRLERLPGGLGIMADDLIAGLYAGAVLWISDAMRHG